MTLCGSMRTRTGTLRSAPARTLRSRAFNESNHAERSGHDRGEREKGSKNELGNCHEKQTAIAMSRTLSACRHETVCICNESAATPRDVTRMAQARTHTNCSR